MEQWWRNLGIQLGKRWKVVLVAVIAVTAILAVGFSRIEFATGQDSYLNPDSQAAIDNVQFQRNFGGENIVMLLEADEGHDITELFQGENLAELRRLRDEFHQIDEVYASIDPLTTLTFSHNLLEGGPSGVAGSALLGAIQREQPGSPELQARTADAAISTARLGEIPEAERRIGNPAWNAMLLFDNTGFQVGDDGAVNPPPDDERTIRKSLLGVFSDQHHAVGGVVLTGNAGLDELSAGTDAVTAVLDTAEFDGFELTVAGSPIYLSEINDYLQGGMLTLCLAALVVMAIVLVVMFRVRWRLLPLLTIVIGVVWAFALVSWIGIDLSLVTISGMPILIGLGIDFAIQIHNRIEEGVAVDEHEHPIAETAANLGPAVLVATVGAAISFLALQLSQVPMIRDFGVLLAIGVAVIVVADIVIPLSALGVREYRKPTKARKTSLVERVVVKLGSLPTTLGTVFVVAAIAAFAVGIVVEDNIEIESDPLKWISQDSPAVENVNRLEDEVGFSSSLGVLVQANNVADPAVIDVLHRFIDDAEAREDVVSSSALVATLSKIIDIEGASPLDPRPQDIVRAAEVAPDDIQKVLFRPDLTATQVNFRLGPASLAQRAVLVEEMQAELDSLIANADIPDDSILLQGLESDQRPIRATPAGLAVVGTALLENLQANRTALTLLALVVVAIWLLLRFRSVVRALATLVAPVLAVGLSSIVVAALGITLSPLTTVSGPLVIAICAEFSILITARYLEERQRGLDPDRASDRAAGRTGRAFFTSAATTIGGFAVLIGSALPLLRDFGVVVGLNVAIALLAALVVMPPLARWVDQHGWLGIEVGSAVADGRSVRLAARARGGQLVASVVGAIVLLAALGGVLAMAETTSGSTERVAYQRVPLPTTTTATTTTAPTTSAPAGEEPPPTTIDVSGFPTTRPQGVVGGALYDVMVNRHGLDPQVAVCAAQTLYERVPDADAHIAEYLQWTRESLSPVIGAVTACGVDDATIEEIIAAGPP